MMIYLQAIENPGEKTKFEQLYIHYRAYMLKIAYHFLGNEFDAEDALHDAFLSIAKHMDKIQEPLSHKTRGYVAIIVERKAIDIYRKRKQIVNEEFIDDKASVSFSFPNDDDLSQCILKLSPRYRHFIMLKYYHGYTVKEIADMFGVKPDTASKLDQRAKARLEKICRKEGVYDL